MEKRRLTSLRTVLLRYLVLCGGGCVVILMIWWSIFMQLMNVGFLLPAVASAQACADAREAVATMTAETFDPAEISGLCRWAVVQNEAVLQTNMTDRQLKIALNAYHGGSGNLGMMQYQYTVKMADGSFCLLQYDYAVPYADPELRGRLPDFQTCYILLLMVLILGWLAWMTHRTVRKFVAETARLSNAIDAIAAHQPERLHANGAQIREFSATLQAMQTMGCELTKSLQAQWRLEQQRSEEIAALTHDLKTPLTIIQGNADLLAEESLTPSQQGQVEAILRGTERAQQYLAALRSVGASPHSKKALQSHALVSHWEETGQALCTPRGIAFSCTESWQGTIPVAAEDLTRAVENLLENAARYTPRGGRVALSIEQQDRMLLIRVADTGPGFSPEALAKAGEMFYTEASRHDASHQGLGLYFARKTAAAHGGTLRLYNTASGGCAELEISLSIK